MTNSSKFSRHTRDSYSSVDRLRQQLLEQDYAPESQRMNEDTNAPRSSDRAASRWSKVSSFLLSAVLLSSVGILGGMNQSWQASSAPARPTGCTGEPQSGQALSREKVLELLTIAEREAATAVRNVLNAPYCQLPSVEIRAGVQAERSLYALDFDANTWLVVLYEGEEYAGYAFDVMP